MLSLITIGNCYAEWVIIDENDNSEVVSFIDYDAKRNIGSKVRMWVLKDFKAIKFAPDDKVFKSLKVLDEYDCENFSFKTLYAISYSGNLGTGDVVDSHDFDNSLNKFVPVAPNTVGEKTLRAACDLNLDYSDWSLFSISDDNNNYFYYSPSSVTRLNGKVNVWQLIDSKEPKIINEKKYKSAYVKYEYDCAYKTVRPLHAQLITGNMGRGGMSNTNAEVSPKTVFRPITNTQNTLLLKKVCTQ